METVWYSKQNWCIYNSKQQQLSGNFTQVNKKKHQISRHKGLEFVCHFTSLSHKNGNKPEKQRKLSYKYKTRLQQVPDQNEKCCFSAYVFQKNNLLAGRAMRLCWSSWRSRWSGTWPSATRSTSTPCPGSRVRSRSSPSSGLPPSQPPSPTHTSPRSTTSTGRRERCSLTY